MIQARGLTRHFKAKKELVEAVKGIDLDVERGELVAFLGPNGAGKSTTLRMLTTLLPPTAGTATVAGHDVAANPAAVRQRIGYIGQGSGAGHYYRVRDELLAQGRAYGMSRRDSSARADALLETLELEPLRKRTVMTLSGGQRRRLDIAMGLMHQPELLFLDEPSSGLDPQNRAHLWEHILRQREETGSTIFLTTHYLEEADSFAERVIVIDHGKIIADGTSESLKADLAGDLITLTLPDELAARAAAEVARSLRPTHDLVADGATLRLRVADGAATVPPLLRGLDGVGIQALTAEVRRPTLDDVFLALTGRSLREGEARGAAADARPEAPAETKELVR